MNPSSTLVRARLTSLFPSDQLVDRARACGVLERDRKIDVRMLIWALVVGFAVDGEARTIAGYRRAYNSVTDHNIAPSSFYDRFTPALETLLNDLLTHAVEEIAVPHTIGPAFDRFRDVAVADTTIARLQRFLAEFPASNHDESGVKLYLVHVLGSESVISTEITDERGHDSPLFETGSWVRGRLILFDMGFFNYRRFARIDENGGFFLSRVKRHANPVIAAENAEWPGRAIPLVGEQLQDIVGDLQRATIDVDVTLSFDRESNDGTHSTDSKQFRVVGVRDEDADDGYRLYVTNLPVAWFSPTEISTIYRARWEIELVFRELKSINSLGKFTTEKPHIVRIQVLAALLTWVVSRAILHEFIEHATIHEENVIFPRELWAKTFRSAAHLILEELARWYGYPQPNITGFLYRSCRQPTPSRPTLLEEVNQALCGGSTA